MMKIAPLILLIFPVVFPISSFAHGGVDGGGGDVVVIGNQAPVFSDRFADPNSAPSNFVSGDPIQFDKDDSGEALSLSPELRENLINDDFIASGFGAGYARDIPDALKDFSTDLFVNNVVSPDIRVHWVETLPDFDDCNFKSQGLLLPDDAKRLPLGCSVGKHTWVIKTIYDQMSAEDQALFWVHEGLQRYFPHMVLAPGMNSQVMFVLNKNLFRIPVFVKAIALASQLWKAQENEKNHPELPLDQIIAQAHLLSHDDTELLHEAFELAAIEGLNDDTLRSMASFGSMAGDSARNSVYYGWLNSYQFVPNGGAQVSANTINLAQDAVLGFGSSFNASSGLSVDSHSAIVTTNIWTRTFKLGKNSLIRRSSLMSTNTRWHFNDFAPYESVDYGSVEIGDDSVVSGSSFDFTNKPAQQITIADHVNISELALSGNTDLTIENDVKIIGNEKQKPQIQFTGRGSNFFARLFGRGKTSVTIKQGAILDFSGQAICSSGKNNFSFENPEVRITSIDDLKKYCD